MTTINPKNILIGLAALLAVILIFNIAVTINIDNNLKKSAEEQKEKSRLGKIELTVIKNSKCSDCFDVTPILSSIKKAKANITKETTLEFGTPQSREILSKYKIEKVPSIIVTGEISKVSIQGMDNKEDALALTKINPPYTNVSTGRIEGHVSLIKLVAPDCEQCSDLHSLLAQIKQGGVKLSAEAGVTTDSKEGKELIEKYKIGFVPTMIFSSDLKFYDIITKAWPQVGTKESDGSYVLRLPSPPFINLTDGKLRGLVTMTYLLDKSCPECFNASIYKRVLADPKGFAVTFDEEETLDISDAKAKGLVLKYNITQAPTVILSDEISAYPSQQSLKQFFSVEKDGSYVFRKVSVLGNYKDLISDKMINKAVPKTTSVNQG
ncbi:hypothetical protein HYW20_09200 [Candidatus Woesearchaeota archaeon]|nr:hypothetical protein [Candidatus Woesearchaeota archaeon]